MNDWFEAEQRVERAQQLSESLRWEEALAELDVALSINPSNATWNVQRGFILEELGRWEDAVRAYKTGLELEPGDRDVTAALGSALCRLGRFAEAVETFEDLAREYPDFEPAYCHRIGIYAELGEHDQAEQMFYIAQELNEACPHCFFHMGASLVARGDTDRALYCWRRVLQLEPDYIGVNRRIAQAYRTRGDLDTARQYYVRELRDDPGNTEVLYELAELLLESKKVGAAAAKFAQILELEPEHIEARFALGRLWLARGQVERALACFQTVEPFVTDQSELDQFDLAIGEAFLRLGRLDEAEAHLVDAANLRPPNARAAMLLGDCMAGKKRLASAADAFRRVLAINANDHVAHYKLGSCLCAGRRYRVGFRHLTDAIRLRQDYEPAVQAAAVVATRLGRWREARQLLQRALTMDPQNEDLARIYKNLWLYRIRFGLQRIAKLAKRVTGRR